MLHRRSFRVAGLMAAILLLNYGIYYGLEWTDGPSPVALVVRNTVRVGLSALIFGQVGFAIAWAALTSKQWLLSGAIIVVAPVLGKLLAVYSGLDSWQNPSTFIFAAITLFICLAVRACGLRIDLRESDFGCEDLSRTSELQVSLREIALFMAVIALLLTLTRLLREESTVPFALVVPTTAWAVLARQHASFRLFMLVVVSLISGFGAHLAFHNGIETSMLGYDFSYLVSFIVTLTGGFSVLRMLNYRFVRYSRTAAHKLPSD